MKTLKEYLVALGGIVPKARPEIRLLLNGGQDLTSEVEDIADALRQLDGVTEEPWLISVMEENADELMAYLFPDLWSSDGLHILRGRASGWEEAAQLVTNLAGEFFKQGNDAEANLLRDQVADALWREADELKSQWQSEFSKRQHYEELDNRAATVFEMEADDDT